MWKAQDSGKKLTDWKKSSRKREWNLQLKDTKITCFFYFFSLSIYNISNVTVFLSK